MSLPFGVSGALAPALLNKHHAAIFMRETPSLALRIEPTPNCTVIAALGSPCRVPRLPMTK